MKRAESIERIRLRKTPWDIVVIGGGATGIGCALDAASRGFDVLLLEQHDFGKGTSSRSTKLVHGGVRYLAQGNISLVREALRERGLLLTNAPHVVHRLAFVVPCYSLWQKFFYGVGLKVYDLLSGKLSFGRSRILSREETIERLPNIKREGLAGGVLYYDGQFDDTRLLIDIAQAAQKNGATLLNYAKVTKIESGTPTFEDVGTGEQIEVSARTIINAAGIFSDDLRKIADEKAEKHITFSQGIHLVFDRKFLPSEAALMIPKTSDGRILFCIPWHDHLLVGTTDTPVGSAVLEPHALEKEIDFILETASEYLAERPTRRDILSVFAGIRPLIKSGGSSKTSSLSRSHHLFVDASGLITITGGKWTTYRKMAEDAVDKAIQIGRLEKRNCVTEDLKIDGPEVSGDSEKLHPDLPYTQSDVISAVRNEMALNLEDVLARRTRVLFLNAKAAIEIAPHVAEIMAKELGKDENWIADEILQFEQTAQNYLIDVDLKSNREF
jgi:glycerol-3-phosphate dehydrogenase